MKHIEKAIKKSSLSTSTTNHLLWGVVCAVLLLFALTMWQNLQALTQQNKQLKSEISVLSARKASCTARDTWQSGTAKTFQTLTADGLREYAVHLPEQFNPTAFYPLIVHFPGKGASVLTGANQARLDVLPAIIAYPYPTVGNDGYTAWQGAPYSSGADDVGFTAEMLDALQAQLCIDRSRVYATGLSNGGGMVSLLSCQLSNRFAAFGIVAGAMYYPIGGCSPSSPTPLISIHGDEDKNVPYNGSVIRKLPAINAWSAERARDNQCSTVPAVTHPDAVTTVTIWKNCKNNATVENVLMHGRGHLWLPEATQMIWQFMSKHTL